MARYQSNERLLRLALTANGLFSLVTGALCLVFASQLSTLFFAEPFVLLGFSSTQVVFELGLGLLLFAALVLWTAAQQFTNRFRARLITIMDAGWVVTSLALLLVGPAVWTSLGAALVLGVAIIVGFFALDQALGLAKLYQGSHEIEADYNGKRMTLRATGFTSASPERVWQVMSHQEAYADVADNIESVEVTSGHGADMQRRCTDNAGRSWDETCTLWDEGRAYAFRVHTEAADYPYPIAALSGEWALKPMTDGTQITMTFNVTAKSGLLNGLMFKMMAAPFSSTCDKLLLRWIGIMEGRTSTIHPELQSGIAKAQLA